MQMRLFYWGLTKLLWHRLGTDFESFAFIYHVIQRYYLLRLLSEMSGTLSSSGRLERPSVGYVARATRPAPLVADPTTSNHPIVGCCVRNQVGGHPWLNPSFRGTGLLCMILVVWLRVESMC